VSAPSPADLLAVRVAAGGSSKPFGEMTTSEVRARADELRSVTGWGPTARVAGVALAWATFAKLMEQRGVATVSDMDAPIVAEHVERLWIVPPGGSLL
jgi:hypothetical protein